MKNKIVCVIGLGYVGLPLAEAFSSHLKTIAFDIDKAKVKRLSESNNEANIEFTADPSQILENESGLCERTEENRAGMKLSNRSHISFAENSRDCYKRH